MNLLQKENYKSMDLSQFYKSDTPYQNNFGALYAWLVAKRIAVLIGILLLLEYAYFVNTASSSFEVTLICIFIFALISNIPILYSLYKDSD
jgi:hypothetical protein